MKSLTRVTWLSTTTVTLICKISRVYRSQSAHSGVEQAQDDATAAPRFLKICFSLQMPEQASQDL